MTVAKRRRGRATQHEARIMREALAHGRDNASALLARKGKALMGGGGQSGLLIAEGDSWFDFPGDDVLALLEDDFGYRVESVAHKGDTVEGMAYDTAQLKSLARVFEHVQQDGRVPRAILLSGGGNDVAGDEFALLLNHSQSGLPPLNARIVEGVLEERLRFAIGSVIGALTALSEQFFGKRVPVLLHGYGNPVPDGRGFLGGFWILPGPWLQPGFSAKGYDDIKRNVGILVDLIDRFNGLLESIAGSKGFEHVTYVDVRDLLSNNLAGNAYKKSWSDELHPTDEGFARIAQAFDQAINDVAPAPAGQPKGPKGRKRGASVGKRKRARRGSSSAR